MRLPKAYRKNGKKCPDCNSIRLSFEKVENVVNPPQKPVVRKRASPGLPFVQRLVHPHNRPIIRLPRIFTVKVAQGKPFPAGRISSETR